MKWLRTVIAALLLVNSVTLAAPIPANFGELSSFEKDLARLEMRIQAQAAKRAKANKITKIASASIGVAGVVGGIGYITSSAIPMAVLHRQRDYINAYNEEVARADAAARERAREAHEMPTTFKIEPIGDTNLEASKLDKRTVLELAGTGLEKGVEGLEHAGTIESKWSDKDSLWDERHPVWHTFDPASLNKLPPGKLEKPRDHDAETVEDRVQLLQDTMLKMRKEEHLKPVRDKFGRWMLGLGAASTVVTLASAELVNENSVEYYMTWPKLADPSNLDMATCLKYAAKISSLDCSKAKPVVPVATPSG